MFWEHGWPLGCLQPQILTYLQTSVRSKFEVAGTPVATRELFFVIAERHLRQNAKRNITWFLEKAVLYWLPLSCQALHNYPFASVCARNHYHELSPDVWKRT